MRSLEKIDQWIAGKVKHWTSLVSGDPPRKELLEIRRDILEDVHRKIQPKGGGRSVFPYQGIAIRIAAENAEQQELRKGVFTGEDGLESDIKDLLKEAGCSVPSMFPIEVLVVEDDELAGTTQPFAIEYTAVQAPAPAAAPTAAAHKAPSAGRPPVKLTVLRGTAEPPELSGNLERINIGRLKDVFGERDGLRRRNDIAFADTETSVSREHAYIRYQAAEGRFRLYDSGSQRGASVYRDGRRIEVPRGPTRGVQLQSGDEIHLGEALLRFEIAPDNED
jgi:hypothetical protein